MSDEMEGDGGQRTKVSWATINKKDRVEREEGECVWMCAHERDSEMRCWRRVMIEWRATTSDKQRQVTSNDEWRATTRDECKTWSNKTTINKRVRREKRNTTVRVWATDKECNMNTRTVLRYVRTFVGKYFFMTIMWRTSVRLAALVFFFNVLVRAYKRAITAVRTYSTTGTYVVC